MKKEDRRRKREEEETGEVRGEETRIGKERKRRPDGKKTRDKRGK